MKPLTLLLILAANAVLAAGEADKHEQITAARVRVEEHLALHVESLRIRREELRERSVTELSHGVLFRFDQYFEGVRVRGGELMVTVPHDEGTVLHRNYLHDFAPIDVRPRVRAANAQREALKHLRLEAPPRRLEASLVILRPRSINDVPLATKLAWEVGVTSSDPDPFGISNVWIDAQSGEVIAAHSELTDCGFGGRTP